MGNQKERSAPQTEVAMRHLQGRLTDPVNEERRPEAGGYRTLSYREPVPPSSTTQPTNWLASALRRLADWLEK